MKKENNAVINLTSSRSCGRQNMRDIKTLYLTAPISRISSRPQGRDDEGRKNKEKGGQALPDKKGLFLRPLREKVGKARRKGCSLFNIIDPSPALPGILSRKGRGKYLRGFTLIELLVVVLIIAILAAVALPQYQKAIEKSRAAQGIAFARSIYQAQETYYLTNGSYTSQLTNLELSFPWKGTLRWHGDSPRGVSNEQWALQIYDFGGNYAAVAARISGQYKGAAFMVFNAGKMAPKGKLVCSERRGNLNLFKLAEGDYCQKVLHATTRLYRDDRFTIWDLP